MMPVAAAAGIRIVLAIQPIHALAFSTDTRARIAAFADYVGRVARRWPQVREFVIGNEPNVRRFFQPQHAKDGTIVSAAVYEQLLAASYDTLKAIDPTIKVDGLGLSPRGNDRGVGVGAESVSPVRFIAALGAAYRKSGRTTPIADVVDVHAYSNINTQPLTRPYQWPQAGAADLDRAEQLAGGTRSMAPRPAGLQGGERSREAQARWLRHVRLDESGRDRARPTRPRSTRSSTPVGRYVPLVDEATQARFYNDLISPVKCEPYVETLDLFHLIDEPLLLGFEQRPAVVRRQPTAFVRRRAQRRSRRPAPAYERRMHGVTRPRGTGARGSWNLKPKLAVQRTFWAKVGAGEEATAEVGVRGGHAVAARSLEGGASTAEMQMGWAGPRVNIVRTLKFTGCNSFLVAVFAALLHVTMNPTRTKLLVSKPFMIC